MKKETLARLQKSLTPSACVCSHITESVKSGDYSIEIYPIYTMLGFSYSAFWCCEMCKKKYHVPDSGAYVVEKEDLVTNEYEHYTLTSEDYEKGDNAFQNLIVREITGHIALSDLKVVISKNKVEKNIKGAARVPFGAVLIK